MKLIIVFLLSGLTTHAQLINESPEPVTKEMLSPAAIAQPVKEDIKLNPGKWKMTGNRWLTGGLVLLAGASKGFNETLMFHWKGFRHSFPKVNPNWFNPDISWRNKYKNGDPDAGAKFPLSTTVLVMFTDQYHLNNFINKAAWTSTVVIKVCEGKKPLKHYLLDFLFYTACHQLGFMATYYPFKNYRE